MKKIDALRYVLEIKENIERYADDAHRENYEGALDFVLKYMLNDSRIKSPIRKKPAIAEMEKRLAQGKPIYGLSWGHIGKIEASSLELSKKGYVYCSGHGQYDWYDAEDYGKTWAWRLKDFDESCLNEV